MRIPVVMMCVLVSIAGCAASAPSPVEDEGASSSDEAIVGGTVAQQQWPGAVGLLYQNEITCGGALIAPQWVLTAAHCVETGMGATGGLDSAVIGRLNLHGSGGETIRIKRATRHPRYDGNDNDLALLELQHASNARVAPLPSASQNAQVVAGVSLTVVGWGVTREDGDPSEQLRQVTVPMLSVERCQQLPGGYSRVSDNQICAGFRQGGRDSCQGDSGGPLYMMINNRPIEVGLVSWGNGCALANAPGVYTRIGNYTDWISRTTGGAVHPG